MMIDCRCWLRLVVGVLASHCLPDKGFTRRLAPGKPLKITRLEVIPIALPDPPLLAVSGCHGLYFLRHMFQLHTRMQGL